jgi:ABC-type Co2+ transport system permease subunit
LHIPDGFISPVVAALMFGIAITFLTWSWKKVKVEYPKSFIALLSISSAFVFAAQMLMLLIPIKKERRQEQLCK